MFIKEFRNKEFVDRDNEIKFIKNWIDKVPEEILWLYGPKSCGKTTLIEYIIENFYINNSIYINFRKIFDNDRMFIYLTNELLNKEGNIFDREGILNFIRDKNIKLIIFDNFEGEITFDNSNILKEFLNFCVALTKELHLAHVIILSSNTIFINKIYNEAKLKVTSSFYKIDHLDKENVFKYIEYKNKKENLNLDKNLIYEYLGGSVALISRLFRKIKFFNSLKEYLENEAKLAKSEIKIFIEQKKLSKEQKEKFYFIMKEIIKNDYFDNDKFEGYLEVIDIFCEQEILFFDPLENKVTANNKLYQKAFELLLKGIE